MDVLKVNAQVKELEKNFQTLATEKLLLQTQFETLEANLLIEKHLHNLNFIDTPQNIQGIINEIIKQINLKNLKLTQEDHEQYIILKNAKKQPVLLMGNFGPDSFTLLVSNPVITDFKNYLINLNTWHGIEIKEMNKEVKKILEYLEK